MLSAAVGRIVLWAFGWSFGGSIPNVSKAVCIVAPHTSNLDFFVGIAAMFALNLRVVFLGKHTLFVWPLGTLMRWLGGAPVDRREARGVVDETVDLFAQHERMILALAPEGTRRSVDRWKTGFYWVALESKVPIIPIVLDFGRRVIRFESLFEPTGNVDGDLRVLGMYFAGVGGRRDR